MQLFDDHGHRKYLTEAERTTFLEAAKDADPSARTFALTLAYTGCRISEALALTAQHIDVTHHRITFETLKRRRKGVFRAIPVPSSVTDALDLSPWHSAASATRGGQKNPALGVVPLDRLPAGDGAL